MNREDFPILKKDIIYFDNGATTLKPLVLSKAVNEYYNEYSANAHRGDYDISVLVDNKYENTRNLVKEFINAKKSAEIIFTSGATDSLNKIIFGYFKNYLKENDEVLITKSEHASNVLPWFELEDNINIKVKYIELTKDLKVTLENVKKAVNEHTKVISIAHVTNVVGDIRPIKKIIEFAHKNGILVLIDGAQSVPHIKVDVQGYDIDFLVFSAHKMCGPTGVGVIYGKEKLLNKMKPIIFGGGMNSSFESDHSRVYNEIPHKFEAGTPNIAGVIAFGEIVKYLNKIGINNIHKHEAELKKYALEKLKSVKDIIIYNETSESGIIAININSSY